MTLAAHHKPFWSARIAHSPRAPDLVGALLALWRAERRGAREQEILPRWEIDTRPGLGPYKHSPSGIPAHPSPQPPASCGCQHRLLRSPHVALGWGRPAAWAPLGGCCQARVMVLAAFDRQASRDQRQSLWQGVVPLQLAGGAAVAAPAQVASLLQLHAGEVYLEAAIVEVVTEA